jgi:hypothetical protein
LSEDHGDVLEDEVSKEGIVSREDGSLPREFSGAEGVRVILSGDADEVRAPSGGGGSGRASTVAATPAPVASGGDGSGRARAVPPSFLTPSPFVLELVEYPGGPLKCRAGRSNAE